MESDSYIDNVVPIEHVKHETDNKASDDGTNEEIEKKAGKKKVKKRKRHWKVYGIVAVLAMMWSMVSIGGTPFFSRGLNDIIGDREMVKVNTEREDGDKNKIGNYEEESVYEDIKDKMGVDVVRLRITSKEMSLVQSDIDEVLKRVSLIYDNKKNIIEYQIVFNYKEQSHGYDVEDKKIKEEQIKVAGNNIDIFQYELPDGNKENIAQFIYEDVFYTINATMDEDEFKELLKNLYFF